VRENSVVYMKEWAVRGCGGVVGDGVPKIVGGWGAGAGFGKARIGVKSHVPGLGPGDKEKRWRKKSLMEHD
jgi:hypothetical protein